MTGVMEPVEREVMAALVCRGHYPETPNGFEWAQVDAQRIVEAWRESRGGPTMVAAAMRRMGGVLHDNLVGAGIGPDHPGAAIALAMSDTAMHDFSSPPEVGCFHADQAAVWAVLDRYEP